MEDESKLRLTPPEEDVLDHWKKYRPRMVEKMRQEGTLLQSVREKTDLMIETYTDLIQEKVPHDRANEIARPLAYLPDEEDEEGSSDPPQTTLE